AARSGGVCGEQRMVVSLLKEMKSATEFHFSVVRGVRSCRRDDDDEAFANVVAALEDTRRKPRASLDAWAAKIEARRAALRRAKEVVEIVDFGATDYETSGHSGVRTKVAVSKLVEASKSAHWGRLLYHLTRRLRAVNVLEMGTCVGVSASYLGAALEDEQRGRLVTLEGEPPIAALAEETFRVCGVTRARCVVGPFAETFAGALEELAEIDLAFVDGNHTEQATIEYFEQLQPFMNEGGVIVFDDIAWSDGMRNAW